ncbi:MAG: glycosyltransferase, partial [bacterium]
DACHIRDYTPPPSADDLPTGRVAGLVSVVVLAWNQLPLTQACLASVRRHTHHPLQLIVVDNGSSDGTVEWLRAEAVAHADTTLVENASNLGFAAGCNQGLARAHGEWVVLLNNDTVVTDGWLDGMIAVHGALRNAGFVGPVTNEIAGLQRAVAPDYVRADLDAFAAAWRERHRHQRVPSPRLVGFCLLGHASLWARVGGLDESYATGNYEDDDLCLRAELAGFRNVIAGEVFIHHEGSASFVGNGVDHRATMAANRARFLAKWRAGAEDTAIGRRVLLHEAVERARVLEETGRLQEAIELCLEAVRVSPTESLAYRILAEMLLHAGHAQDALDVLANLPAGPADGTSRVLIACASLAAGDVARALRIADAVDEEGDLRSRALNLRGLVAHAAGDLEQANRCFNAAIAADRGNGLPYSNLGAMLWEREPGDAAFGLFVRALTLSPLSSDALASLCDAAKTLGRVPEARVAVREARGFHPVHRGLACAAIDLALADGDAVGAMEAIEDALEWFGFDDAFLQAALAVRARVGPRTLGERDGSPDTLSVCLIVRNEEERLVRALRSVLPIADEVVVVDSGSTDRTRELATVLGARVVEHEWTGDFSAARNASLEAAHGAWVLVLDADEAIATSDLPRLRAALREPNGVAGWTLVTRNYGDDASVVGRVANDGSYPRDEAGSGWHPSRKVRLFRNDPRVRFEGALHEVVDDALRRHDLLVAGLDVPVHHYGAFAREREREKAERYLDLARRKLAEAPDDTQALWECAVQAGVAGRHDEAVGLWTRWLRLPDPAREAVAWLNLGRAHLELHAYTEAARATRKALERDPESRDAARNLALCELGRGRTREAKTLAMRLAHEGAEASTWALVAATAVLTRDDDALAIARRGLEGAGAAAATALQAHAVRLRLAGRTNEAARLESAVRDEWRALLAARGLDDSDEAVETLVREGERALGTVAERSAV